MSICEPVLKYLANLCSFMTLLCKLFMGPGKVFKHLFKNFIITARAKKCIIIFYFNFFIINSLILLKPCKNNKNFLEFQELLYLNNWEAENYRKKIKN